jgi:hypothetical protein
MTRAVAGAMPAAAGISRAAATALRAPGFLSAAAAVAMGIALQISSGTFDPAALVLATLSAAAAVWAALLRGPTVAASDDPARAPSQLSTQLVLGVGLLHGLFCHLFALPTFYAQPLRLAGFRGLALMAVVILASYLCVHLRASLQRARFWASLAIFLAMGAAIIHVSNSPRVDVWPAWAALGDVRWLALLSIGIAAWAIARLGGGATAELAALFVLFQGRSFLALENAWTETLVLAAFAIATLVALRPAKRLPQWLALGLGLGVLAEALYRGLVQMQLAQPLRVDSLSLLALWARAFGAPAAGAVPAFAAAALVLFASLWRRPFAAVRAPAVAAAAWLVFVLLNKQAFCNYDWLGLGLCCVAVAALSKET